MDKVQCEVCGSKILQTTADRNNGLCAPCKKKILMPSESDIENKSKIKSILGVIILSFAIAVPILGTQKYFDYNQDHYILIAVYGMGFGFIGLYLMTAHWRYIQGYLRKTKQMDV